MNTFRTHTYSVYQSLDICTCTRLSEHRVHFTYWRPHEPPRVHICISVIPLIWSRAHTHTHLLHVTVQFVRTHRATHLNTHIEIDTNTLSHSSCPPSSCHCHLSQKSRPLLAAPLTCWFQILPVNMGGKFTLVGYSRCIRESIVVSVLLPDANCQICLRMWKTVCWCLLVCACIYGWTLSLWICSNIRSAELARFLDSVPNRCTHPSRRAHHTCACFTWNAEHAHCVQSFAY